MSSTSGINCTPPAGGVKDLGRLGTAWRAQRFKIFELPSGDGSESGIAAETDMMAERYPRAHGIPAAR
jgi:hypothetical protein